MESLNRSALDLVDEAIDFADELSVAVHHLDNEAAVLDFGVDVHGGIEAGLLLAEIQTGGLATVGTRIDTVAGRPRTHVDLATDHPHLALLGSALSDWRPAVMDAVGSGPARLFEDGAAFRPPDYAEDSDFAVLALEADRLPAAPVATEVASRCGVPESGVFLPTTRPGSVAGSVSVAGRAAEVAMLRLANLGYDPANVVSAAGSAPVAPVAGDRETALSRVNDALSHGAQVHLVVTEDSPRFEAVPFGATEHAGTSMGTLLAESGWDLHAVPECAFAPAQVTIDVTGGETYSYGERDQDQLAGFLDH